MIGLIDADLLDRGTRHPNLALMKISNYYKGLKKETELLLDYQDLNNYKKIFISKVFTKTKIPIDINKFDNIVIGGTGFFFDKAPDLPHKVEHTYPDYNLYNRYIEEGIKRGIKPNYFSDFINYSIGFMTRGCFRKCEFCVNRKYNKVFRHAKVSEFYDPTRKYIHLWDDNILGYSRWKEIFDELAKINRPFRFRQGLDIRLLTDKKAHVLSESKYLSSFIFAFDFIKDRKLIENKLILWRKYCLKTTKLYVLCGYKSTDIDDIISIFERIKILFGYDCIPYIMRFEGREGSDRNWEDSRMRGMYINIARWVNQPGIVKKMSFLEFCQSHKYNSSTRKYFREFIRKYPWMIDKYFNIKWGR